jgi:hypothetical protein
MARSRIMGQYYKALIINKNGDIKTLSPHDFGNSMKLMSFSWCGNYFVNAVLSLIHNKRAKVAFIGDYSASNEDFNDVIMTKDAFMEYYGVAWGADKKKGLQKSDFTETDLELMDVDTSGAYLVNHDTREFVNIEIYIEDSLVSTNNGSFAINPLPLLTVCGNGLGNGDYPPNAMGCDDVGSWAFNTLEYVNKIPDEYTQAYFVFKE